MNSGLTTVQVAQVIHEAVRVLQTHIGEEVSPPWGDAPEWMKHSTLQGVQGVMEGNTPEQSHEQWMATRLADGWTLGPVKDVEAKVSPCLVPYDELPPAQRAKDHLFVAIAHALLDLERG